ncbi:MAG: SNF2 helicase associated domain-containing protein [Candidatus Limivivens sp.]|nr:SNF2 helicase associated domain-containing protein [Candidatus Limivivens sp.]
MNEWKTKFSEDTLERGRALFLNGRVTELKETEKGYSAAVLARERNEVSVRMTAAGVGRMSCMCPAARGGRSCEHMSALMYAVEAAEARKEDSKKEKELLEQWRRIDAELRQAEQAAAEKEKQKKELREERKRIRRMTDEEKQAAAEEKRRKKEEAAAEKKRLEAEQAAAEEKRRREEEAAAEKKREEEAARALRRQAREERKAERARQKEEQKQLAEKAAREAYEKRLAEEERREKIRQQKAEEARRRAEKRQKELEEQERRRKEDEQRRIQEEQMHRQEEERRRKEEERRRKEEERRRKEEEQRMKEAQQRKTEYTLLGGGWEEGQPDGTEAENGSKVLRNLEDYRYFDGGRIRRSVEIPKEAVREGERLYRQGGLEMRQIISGFVGRESERRGQMNAVGKEGKTEFPICIVFSRKEVLRFDCGCRKCRKDYFSSYYVKKTDCPYKAGALNMLEDYLQEHSIGDATNWQGERLMGSYEMKRANQIQADMNAREQSLRLVPRLTKSGGKLSLSFKVGESRLFVIKKLDVFCDNVRNSATDTYGSSTEINHAIGNFTDAGRGWIRFLNRIVREEWEFQQRLQDSRHYYGKEKESIGGTLNLFGWRLDEFFAEMGSEAVEFEDKDDGQKKKATLSCAEGSPRITMRISEDLITGDPKFHGIQVEGTLPELYYGTDTAYYISDEHLYRVSRSFLEKAKPLADLSDGNRFSFCLGRNRISEFYSRILPQLREIAEITETQPEKFRSYLLPEARFVFFLDAEEGDAVCQLFAWYGDREVSVLDILSKGQNGALESFRDAAREEEILYYAMQWLPEINWEKRELCCGKDESRIYQLIRNGTERLMELGEVRCTRGFLGWHAVNHVRVSVGVSVSSGLLELDISTEDVPRAELLEILKSYRTKKKYYRLKDGAFVDLEEPSLEMLAELSQAMNLKDREMLKGKLKLPMYRTLYLDKLLEENEEVYSSRDSRFREIVKEFKTVKDADFEEPKSLSKRMRKYQKDGYKWLRTLEAWKFGGILADDMGLGKTLQVIAVMLAAKEEGKKGTSLVVTPASLVFNWGAEFEKFAPDLTVSLVTGTQEERQKKIEAYQEADVLVTSYDLLKRDIAFYEGREFAYEIIDEAQYIKNHTTAAAKAVKVISSRIRYALTGTPIENRLSELWSIFDYLMPGFLFTYDVFKREIETPVVKNNDQNAMKRLQKMVGPFILRRLKEDVLKDLPEKLEEYRYVRLGDAQQKVYDGQVLHMKEQIGRQDTEEFNKNKLQILAELTRLRQICCDPSLCFENYKGEAAKLEACLELVQSAMDGGHRILLFSQFTSMLEVLQDKLKEAGIAYYTITGSTSKEKRLELVKSFNEGSVPVFLISLKAGGVGLNLTGADVVIHYDPWWNLAAQNQATDRAHRIGQTKKVTVYKLIARHTIEEKIQKLQETKKNLADQVMNGESGNLGSMSREDILELLEV